MVFYSVLYSVQWPMIIFTKAYITLDFNHLYAPTCIQMVKKRLEIYPKHLVSCWTLCRHTIDSFIQHLSVHLLVRQNSMGPGASLFHLKYSLQHLQALQPLASFLIYNREIIVLPDSWGLFCEH